MQTIRQGDLVLVAAADLDADFGPTQLQTLAIGEESGHSHVLTGALAEVEGRRFIRLDQADELRVEGMPWRHDPITVPAGVWEVRVQREYTPEGIRNVAD